MPLTLIHTSDWHLGHTLYERTREDEHVAFFGWLTEQLVEQEADVLLVTGDIYDVTNPPSSAMAALYRFLAQVSVRCPRLQVFITAGNHDSPGRIDAPAPLLREFRVEVIGSFDPQKPERVVFPLKNRRGEEVAWLAAVPFLRPADLPTALGDVADGVVKENQGDPMVDGVREVYRRVLSVARARRQPGQALLATGHCYMVGTRLSELSERRILGGNQHALPADIFPDDVAYAALGHLHRPQRVGGHEHIRYAGSPIPLSMDERAYHHRVVKVRIEGERLLDSVSLPIPRSVPLIRIPDDRDSYLPLAELIPALRALPVWEGSKEDAWRRPFLEVGVVLEGPTPGLHRLLERELEGRAARLCSIRRAHVAVSGPALTEQQLGDLRPEDVFLARWSRESPGTEPPPELMRMFLDLLEQAEHEDRA